VWEELLEHKHDLDLTGNGLNHPATTLVIVWDGKPPEKLSDK